MGYSSNPYRRGYVRAIRPGRVARPNRRPGACHYCGTDVPAGAGQLYMESSGAWSVAHPAVEWAGSPVSGHWAGGCPDGTPEAPRDTRGGYIDECGSCGAASCSC